MTNKKDNIMDHPIVTWVIGALVVFSAISFSLETLPDLKPNVQRFLRYSEIAIVVVFTVEYLCRVMLAERKLKFIFSFYGLVDLLAILPFYLAFAVDLRTLRLLRFMRLLRMLKFVRYRAAIERFGGALWIAKEELIIFATAILVFLYLAAVGIYYFEHKAQPEIYRTIFDSLWWAVTSLTTVGYGDMYPITTGGRVFSFFVLMLGLGLIGVPAGIVASALSAVRRRDERAESSDE
jgi:voltage-gated potassium channel